MSNETQDMEFDFKWTKLLDGRQVRSDLKVFVSAVSHTIPGSQDIFGSHQGSPTEMTVVVHQWDHPGIFIFLEKSTLIDSHFIWFLDSRKPLIHQEFWRPWLWFFCHNCSLQNMNNKVRGWEHSKLSLHSPTTVVVWLSSSDSSWLWSEHYQSLLPGLVFDNYFLILL